MEAWGRGRGLRGDASALPAEAQRPGKATREKKEAGGRGKSLKGPRARAPGLGLSPECELGVLPAAARRPAVPGRCPWDGRGGAGARFSRERRSPRPPLAPYAARRGGGLPGRDGVRTPGAGMGVALGSSWSGVGLGSPRALRRRCGPRMRLQGVKEGGFRGPERRVRLGGSAGCACGALGREGRSEQVPAGASSPFFLPRHQTHLPLPRPFLEGLRPRCHQRRRPLATLPRVKCQPGEHLCVGGPPPRTHWPGPSLASSFPRTPLAACIWVEALGWPPRGRGLVETVGSRPGRLGNWTSCLLFAPPAAQER